MITGDHPHGGFKARQATSLRQAIVAGQAQEAQQLISEGADVNAATEHGVMAIHMVALKGHEDILQLLLRQKAAVNAVTNNDETAILLSAREKHRGSFELLFKAGADVMQARSDGMTVLHYACRNDWIEFVEELTCIARLDIDVQTADNATPLILAAAEGRVQCVQLLLKLAADPTIAQSSDGATCLHYAAQYTNAGVVKQLLEQGGDVDAVMTNNATPLMLAASAGNLEIVELLVGVACCDSIYNSVDKAEFKGYTAMDFALEKGHRKVARELEDAGACAPCKDRRSLVRKKILVNGREGTVKGIRVKLGSFGDASAKSNKAHEYSVDFDGDGITESVKLLQLDNGGASYSFIDRLDPDEPVEIAVTKALHKKEKSNFALADKEIEDAVAVGNSKKLLTLLVSGAQIPANCISSAILLLHKTEQDSVDEKLSNVGSLKQQSVAVAVVNNTVTKILLELQAEEAVLQGNLQDTVSVQGIFQEEDHKVKILCAQVSDLQIKEWEAKAQLSQCRKEVNKVEQQIHELVSGIQQHEADIVIDQSKILTQSESVDTCCAALTDISNLLHQIASPGGFEQSNNLNKVHRSIENGQRETLLCTFGGLGPCLELLQDTTVKHNALVDARQQLLKTRKVLKLKEKLVRDAEVVHQTAAQSLGEQQKMLDAQQIVADSASVSATLDACIGKLLKTGLEENAIETNRKRAQLKSIEDQQKDLKASSAAAQEEHSTAKKRMELAKMHLVAIENMHTHTQAHAASTKEANALMSILNEHRFSYRVQLAGTLLLAAFAKNPKLAGFINSAGGQQIVATNIFKQLVFHECTRSPAIVLKRRLGARRLKAYSAAKSFLSSDRDDVFGLVGMLCDPHLREDEQLLIPAAKQLVSILSYDCRLIHQFAASNRSNSVQALHSLQCNCVSEELKALVSSAVSIVTAARAIETSTSLSEIVRLMQTFDEITNSCTCSVVSIGAEKLVQNIEVIAAGSATKLKIAAATLSNLKIILDQSMAVCIVTDGSKVELVDCIGPLISICEVAEWIVTSDANNEGWATVYLRKMVNAGITSIHIAKQRFQESGDLRELLEMKKEPAQHLFALLDPAKSVESDSYRQLCAVLANPVFSGQEELRESAARTLVLCLEHDTSNRIVHSKELVVLVSSSLSDLGVEDLPPKTKVVVANARKLFTQLETIHQAASLHDIISVIDAQDLVVSLFSLATAKILADECAIVADAPGDVLQRARVELIRAQNSSEQVLHNSRSSSSCKLRVDLSHSLGVVELAEWLSLGSVDKNGTRQLFLNKLKERGVANLYTAKERFQEPGDLRELLQIKKEPAHDLFKVLRELCSNVACR